MSRKRHVTTCSGPPEKMLSTSAAPGLVPLAPAPAPAAGRHQLHPAPAQLRRLRRAHPAAARPAARVTAAAGGSNDSLNAVQRALEANARELSSVPATGSTPSALADSAAALAALMDEERRLADLEAQLAEAEKGITANERQMLDLLLQRQALAASAPDAVALQARLRSTEAEAAALRALVTAGRSDVEALVEPVVVEAPVVRTVMDWQAVDWARLSLAQRLGVLYDIFVGKTLDQWSADWAFARAEGFGLRGLGTVALAFTVIVCLAYSLLAGATGGVATALTAKPFALPTSTLLVLARVTLSSILVMAEQVCTLIYYTPAAAVAALAAVTLVYREKCKQQKVVPVWTRLMNRQPGATERAVLLRKVPVPMVPPVYYKGITLPQAIEELAAQPGAVWPPQLPPTPRKGPVPFTLAEDVSRLLYGTPSGPRGATTGGMASSASRLAAAAQQQPEAPPVPDSRGRAGGADWRLEPLEGTLSKTSRGVMNTAKKASGGGAPLGGLLTSVSKSVQSVVKSSSSSSSSTASAESSIQAANAAGGGNEAMSALRSRFAAMQGQLELGAEQAADDGRNRLQ